MKIIAALSIFLLVGCATTQTVAPIAGASLEPMTSQKIAVTYSFAEKRLNLSETLYRVLWLEENASSDDISGIWNPDYDATRSAVVRLRQQGFAAENLLDVVDESLVAPYIKVSSQGILQNSVQTSNASVAKNLPDKMFFLKTPDQPQFAVLSAALREKGFHYLVEMNAMNIIGTAPGYGMVIVAASPNVRIIDLKKGQPVWSAALYHHDVFQLGGDLKALEKNGMQKTKEGLATGIGKLDFAAAWGLGRKK